MKPVLVSRSSCVPCHHFGRLCIEHKAQRAKGLQAARKRASTLALKAEVASLRKQLDAAQRDLAAFQAREELAER